MLTSAVRLACRAPPTLYSPFSTTINLPTTPPHSYASRSLDRSVFLFQRELLRKTDDPLWFFQYRLRYPRQLGNWGKHSEVLSKTGITYEEYRKWRPVIYASNIDDALSIMKDAGIKTIESYVMGASPDGETILSESQPPSWLVLYLASHKVRTPIQAAQGLMSLVNSHLFAAPVHLQPPILIFSTLTLASYGVSNPMRNIIQTFLSIPLTDSRLYFNLLLLAISRFPKSTEVADLVVMLLEAMKSRQVNLRSHTYEVLLADRFVTVQLTKVLRAHMLHEGFTPKASHLEAYLRVFAKDGAIHDARRYLNAIRAQALQSNSDDVPYGVEDDRDKSGSAHATNTLYLSAFDDRASAFRYLGQMLERDKSTPSAPLPPSRFHRSFVVRSRSRLQRRRFDFHRKRKKRSVDIYDWTTALAVAARDKSTTAKQLIRLLHRARSAKTAFRPTVATYTVVLRGLIYRKDLKGAETVWHELRCSGLRLDDKALTIGLQVLTRIGKPHLAFALLELFAAKPTSAKARPGKQRREHGRVIVSTITLNEFMVSLMRIGRPDIVFRLWDHMETLYCVKPDAVTLNVLLKCAHLAMRLDDSVRGAWAELASKNPFRRHPLEPSTREDIIASITSLLGDIDSGLKPYRSGIWKDGSPWREARRIFRQVVLSNRPELMRVRSPANAVRSSRNTAALSPMTELARGLSTPYSSGVYKNTLTLIPPSPLFVGSVGAYPEIVPNDRSFFAYIQLLGLYNQATEIPLVLAWMRALDVKPSTGTLAMALVFWGEVSLHAPLIESWAGGRARSEYHKLVEWITHWLGQDAIPTEDRIGYWLKVVQRLREPRR